MVFVNKVHDVNHVCLGFLIAGHGAGSVFLGVGVFGSFDIDLSFLESFLLPFDCI